MKKITLFAVLLSSFFFFSCDNEHDEDTSQEIPNSVKATEDLPPMVVKKFDQPFSPAMENFHKKILRLSSTEFIDQYNAMTPEQRAVFAAEFLKEESIALLEERGVEVNPKAQAQEIAKEALTHYSAFINQNQ